VRTILAPRLTEESLARLTTHELVRAYPELIPVLRALDVGLEEWGGRPLSPEFLSSSTVRGQLLAATAWRDRGVGFSQGPRVGQWTLDKDPGTTKGGPARSGRPS